MHTRHGIQDRNSSSRFTSLGGVWQIKQLDHVEDFNISESLCDSIPVPSCVQMHGYDQIQYLNDRYPFPVMLPNLPYENPCWHYRRTFHMTKKANTEPTVTAVDPAYGFYANSDEVEVVTTYLSAERATVDAGWPDYCMQTCPNSWKYEQVFWIGKGNTKPYSSVLLRSLKLPDWHRFIMKLHSYCPSSLPERAMRKAVL